MTVGWAMAILGVLTILQSTALPRLPLLGVHPDVVLLAVLHWALLRGMREGLLWALVGGLWLDLLSGLPFGLSIISLILVAFLASLWEASLFREHISLIVLATALLSVLHGGIYVALLRLTGHPAGSWSAFWRISMPTALYTSLLSPIMFAALRWLDAAIRREQLEW